MVTQMAHPRRVAKVAKQIEREVGQLLISDKVLQQAVCPERRRGFDGAVSALASVTEVQISNDLQVAKVYLSIYSDELGVAAAMEGLQKLEGYVRKHIGRQIRLRLTPEVRFVLDDSLERTERVYKLLDQVRKIESGQAEPPPIAIVDGRRGQDEEDAGDDWEDEDEAMEVTVDLGLFDEEEALVRPQQQRQRQRRQRGERNKREQLRRGQRQLWRQPGANPGGGAEPAAAVGAPAGGRQPLTLLAA